MNILVLPPTYDGKQGCHRFTLEGCPSVLLACGDTDATPIAPPPLEELIPFLESFVAQTSKYFTKPLTVEFLSKKIVHFWSTTAPPRPVEEAGVCTHAYWFPAILNVYPTKILLSWEFDHWQEPSPCPGPGQEEAEASSVLVEEKPDTLPPSPDSSVLPPPTPSSLAPPLEEEPALTAGSLPLSGKEKAKQRVRKARLRALLAQVRAEKLAEHYYRKYGTFDSLEGDSDTESDLSWPSDAEVEVAGPGGQRSHLAPGRLE